MIPYKVLIQRADGYLEIQEHDIRPLDAALPGELLRAREIVLPQEQTGTYADPETGEELPLMTSVPIKYCKWSGVMLEAMTQEERATRDAYDADQAAIAEAERQAAKPAKLKSAENKFFDLCNAIFGNYEKRGFDELNTAIETLTTTDPSTATALAIRLLAVDAECKREGGNSWWDTAAYHEEAAQ